MANKFVGFLEAVGRDIKKALPWVSTIGEAAISVFLPGMAPIFNQTVNAVITAEQNFTLVKGTGEQKALAVTQIMGPLIAQALTDAGKPADATAVQNYINAIVTILNTTPAPVAVTSALNQPAQWSK